MSHKNKLTQLGDLVRLDGLEKPEVGREVIVQIPPAGAERIGRLAGKIEDNQDVELSEMEALVDEFYWALDEVGFNGVNYFGDQLTLEQYRSIADRAENTRICRQLANTTDESVGRKIETPRLNYLPHRLVAAASRFAGSNQLILNGLKSLDLELATELGKHYYGLTLWGLEELSPEIARALIGENRAYLNLNGLENLSKEAAEELANFQGERLFLEGLNPSIDREVAKALAKYKNDLHLGGLTEMSLEVARELGEGLVTGLELDRLKEMSLEIIKELLKGKKSMSLCGLSDVSDEVAHELAIFQGALSLQPQVAHKMHVIKVRLGMIRA